MKEFSLLDIKCRIRHPESNGKIERFHRSLREEGLSDKQLVETVNMRTTETIISCEAEHESRLNTKKLLQSGSQRSLFILLFIFGILLVSNTKICFSQEKPTNAMPKAKWLYQRGPFDPRPYKDTLFDRGLIDADYFNMKNRLWIEKGISFGGYVSANIQWGSEGGPSHGISETLLLFTWEPVRKANSSGRLVVGFAYDLTFWRPTTREFADNQRIVETPNDLDTDPKLTFATLGLLHWEHEWNTGLDRGWGIRAGQLYAPSYFGPATYLDDDRRFFMARPLGAAAGAQWVGYNDIGLGLNGIYWNTPINLSVAVLDGNANRQYPDLATLFDADLLYLGEIGLEHDVDGPNQAAIRLTVSHLEVKDGANPLFGSGQSIMLSGDIRFQDLWALAGRWSKSFNRLSADYKELFSLGIMWLKPFGRMQDLVGFGLFAGKPSDASRNLESGGEIFYKLQLTHAISVTPDIQYWLRTDNNSENIHTWIWGIRSEIEF